MFIDSIRQHGGFYRASRAAGIDPKTARRHRDTDEEFAQAVQDAREEHADQLEAELEAMGRDRANPVPHIVRLKALRPGEYIERQAITNANLNVDVVPRTPSFEEVQSLLVRMARNITPATRRLLGLPPEDTDTAAAPEAPEPA